MPRYCAVCGKPIKPAALRTCSIICRSIYQTGKKHRARNIERRCKCDAPHFAKGFCKNCYQRYSYANNPAYRQVGTAYARSYQKIHREQTNANQRKCRKLKCAVLKRHLQKLKSVPCMDCGKTYPHYVMDFDHARGKKLFHVSTSTVARGPTAIAKELAKCDVVCAVCHRIRTYTRKQNHRSIS